MSPTTAVVPVAGRGTRLRPLTHAVPKELLPLGHRPVLDHVVDELRGDGIDRLVVVTSPDKPAIARHLREVGVDCEVVVQPEPRGLGDAVLCAGALVEGPFVVAVGDSVVTPGVVARLLACSSPGAIALQDVEDPSAYGVARVHDGRVAGLVEKPAPGSAPSRLAVAGRWKLPVEIFEALRETPAGRGGEVQLTDAIARLIDAGVPFAAVPLVGEERRIDIGDVASYVAAFRDLTA